jgi:hypothetical protein
MNLYMHLRLNLPLWLSGADLSDNLVSKPPDFYMIMSEYTEVFTQMGGAQMYCHECRLLIDCEDKNRFTTLRTIKCSMALRVALLERAFTISGRIWNEHIYT